MLKHDESSLCLYSWIKVALALGEKCGVILACLPACLLSRRPYGICLLLLHARGRERGGTRKLPILTHLSNLDPEKRVTLPVAVARVCNNSAATPKRAMLTSLSENFSFAVGTEQTACMNDSPFTPSCKIVLQRWNGYETEVVLSIALSIHPTPTVYCAAWVRESIIRPST